MSLLTIPGKQIGSAAIRHGQSLMGLHASAEDCSEIGSVFRDAESIYIYIFYLDIFDEASWLIGYFLLTGPCSDS